MGPRDPHLAQITPRFYILPQLFMVLANVARAAGGIRRVPIGSRVVAGSWKGLICWGWAAGI